MQGGVGYQPARHREAWDFLSDLNVDVAFLQEAILPPWVHDQWSVVHYPKYNKGRRWGSAILARKGWKLTEHKPDPSTPWLLGLREFRCPAVVARLESPRSLWLASIHSHYAPLTPKEMVAVDGTMPAIWGDNGEALYELEVVAPEFQRLAAGKPYILAGDFNTAGPLEPRLARGARFQTRRVAAGLWVLGGEGRAPERTLYPNSGHNKGRQPKPGDFWHLDHMCADSTTVASPHTWEVLREATEHSDHVVIRVVIGSSQKSSSVAEDRSVA
jgi:hypothetical protein